MNVEAGRLAYAINNSITSLNIFNFSNIRTIHQLNFTRPIDDIQLLGPIILISSNIITSTQYDIE